MKRIAVLVAIALVPALLSETSAWAALIEIANPGASYWTDAADTIVAKARNGREKYELVLGVSDMASNSEMYVVNDLPGTPYWTFGSTYNFTLAYAAATGTASFSLLDSGMNLVSSLTNVYDGSGHAGEPNYVGKGFDYIQLNCVGNDLGQAKISNLTYNGSTLGAGTYDSGTTSLYKWFADQNGALLANFTIAGGFVFTADGTADERPKFAFDLGGPRAVPIPSAALLLGSGLAGLAFFRRRRSPDGNV